MRNTTSPATASSPAARLTPRSRRNLIFLLKGPSGGETAGAPACLSAKVGWFPPFAGTRWPLSAGRSGGRGLSSPDRSECICSADPRSRGRPSACGRICGSRTSPWCIAPVGWPRETSVGLASAASATVVSCSPTGNVKLGSICARSTGRLKGPASRRRTGSGQRGLPRAALLFRHTDFLRLQKGKIFKGCLTTRGGCVPLRLGRDVRTGAGQAAHLFAVRTRMSYELTFLQWFFPVRNNL